MTNLDSIFKSRDITLPTKVRLVKAMVFPVVMHGCECWSCRDQEGRRGSEEAVPGPSVFPSGEPGVSGDFWGSQEGCQGGKVMSLLFNMLSRLVITFLSRSKCLLISWLQSPSAVIWSPRK